MTREEILAATVRISRMKLELERLTLANRIGCKVSTVTDAMVCKARINGAERVTRYVLAK